jgi:hypothetical protein
MKMEPSRVCGTVSYNGELWNAWHKCGDWDEWGDNCQRTNDRIMERRWWGWRQTWWWCFCLWWKADSGHGNVAVNDSHVFIFLTVIHFHFPIKAVELLTHGTLRAIFAQCYSAVTRKLTSTVVKIWDMNQNMKWPTQFSNFCNESVMTTFAKIDRACTQ